ncbi:MAG: helix-turn-helix domain-containing protein [Solibacillus sp.]|uniref:helix-turn-helix transcriptional regulator n=1 Tax=unclassified Solibacillus TaxID=2637870 RepID=UPI0031018F33
MEQQQFIRLISEKMKLVRNEHGYSQDKMAEILGLSKKTLLQIEKGRNEAGWTTVVAFCAIFNRSELLQTILGDEPLYFVQLLTEKNELTPKDKTLGGKVWWKEIEVRGEFRLQQNVISSHFRILDGAHYRMYSSFDLEDAKKRLQELAQ